MSRAEALEIAEATLKQAGYAVSRRCAARTSCFDIAARKERCLLFIKVLPDINDAFQGDALGIKAITRCFSCSSLFISDMDGQETLKDDTVYSRYGVRVVTSKTLGDIVRGAFPLVEAIPGGYCVRIDGAKIRERRHELGLSIGKLAEMAGISRRTLYGYERDMTRASVSSAYHLEEILGMPLVKAIDIFETAQGGLNPVGSSPSGFENIKNRLLRLVLGRLIGFDLQVSHVIRAPFDFTAECIHEKFKIVGGVFRRKEKCASARIEEIVSISRIVDARPLLVGKQKVATCEDVAFLNYDEFTRIRRREELTIML